MGRAQTRIHAQILRSIAAVALVISIACTPVIRNHGYMPPPEDLELVTIGVDTRETVLANIGKPVAGGVLNETGFYYVASKFRHFGAFEPVETEREVLAISFDDTGLVRNIERFGLDEGRVVVLSRRVTDDGIRDTTFVRQLLRSIGNFNAGSLLGESDL